MPRRILQKLLIIFIIIVVIHSATWNVLGQNDTLTFKRFFHSKGQTSEGNLTSENIYLASDGEKIYRRGIVYSSIARANEELEERLKGAANILERKPVMKKKQKVGERVVALFSNGVGGEKVLILRTYQEVLVSIEAPSLRHALAFEGVDKL